jgi:hypothetical protein
MCGRVIQSSAPIRLAIVEGNLRLPSAPPQARHDLTPLAPLAPQQLRQLGDVGGDAPRLVTGKQLARGAATGLILAIDEGQRLPVGVAER